MDVLDTYPRDELFQARVDELAPTVEKVAHLKERRQVRLFVRRDAVRSLPLLPGLPAPRPLHHRGPQPDAGDPAAPGSAARRSTTPPG